MIIRKVLKTLAVAAPTLMWAMIPASSSWASNRIGPLTAANFVTSSMAAVPGTEVALHWNRPQPDDYFILVSNGADGIPGFGTTGEVSWPQDVTSTWNNRWDWWSTTAAAVQLAIPSDAVVAQQYVVHLYTCSGTRCSDAKHVTSGGSGEVILTVSNFASEPYSQSYSASSIAEPDFGSPTSVTVDPSNGSVWTTGELSNAVLQTGRRHSIVGIGRAETKKPFAACWPGCVSSDLSALSEQVIVGQDGKIWFTQGGWQFPSTSGGQQLNHSQIVSVDPATDAVCTYEVPGYDNEVVGLASTESAGAETIWFTESWDSDPGESGPSLDSFEPTQVGDGCPGTTSESYDLVDCPASGCNLNRVLLSSAVVPAQLAADPSSSTVWFSDFWGDAIQGYNTETGQLSSYPLASTNQYSFFGADPWGVAADAGYIYAIDYGDDNLIRINKTTGTVDEVPLPLTSDTEQGYGIALSGGNLYFTLSDDSVISGSHSRFGDTSTFGVIDVAAWEAASAECPGSSDCQPMPAGGVVYSGLLPGDTIDLRGVAASGTGTLYIADADKRIMELTPSSAS